MVLYSPSVPCAPQLMKWIADLHANSNDTSCDFIGYGNCPHVRLPIIPPYPGIGGVSVIAGVLGMDLAGRLTEQSFIHWWRATKDAYPVGLTRSLGTTVAVGTWPSIPRPQPPAGDPT